MPCSCTIYDVRREQIEEASGRLWIRLVCNLCESEIDANPVEVGRDGIPAGTTAANRVRVQREPRFEQRGSSEF